VHRFESRFERWRPEVKASWKETSNSNHPALGGILYDLGSHLIDQALVAFGPITHVYAEIAARRPGALVDDDTFLALTHAGGTQSHLWMSAVAAQLGPRFRVLGSHGGYVKHGLDPQEDALRQGKTPHMGWGSEPEPAWGTLGTVDTATPYPTVPGDYPAFYAGIEQTLRAGTPAPVDPHDAIATLTIVEAALRSAAAHQVVELHSA
jgi:predicted dehydrogenase